MSVVLHGQCACGHAAGMLLPVPPATAAGAVPLGEVLPGAAS